MIPLTWLYVPADRPERFAKALASGADVVILDLEDGVAPARKERARFDLLRWLKNAPPQRVEVRVNALHTTWGADDLRALADQYALRDVRLPKVESSTDVATAVGLLADNTVGLQCLIETARGVETAYEIAQSSRVSGICLGEADLRSDLGVSTDDGLLWARSRIVIAARAAGLPAPAMSVYPNVSDLEGLAETSRVGRHLGYVGRSAIHPRQLPVILDAFTPTTAEVTAAQLILDTYSDAIADGNGVALLPDGQMIDAAMIGEAHAIVERARSWPNSRVLRLADVADTGPDVDRPL